MTEQIIETSDRTAERRLDPLKQYLAEIKKYKRLTPDEQMNLAILYKKNGDMEAANKLVTCNLKLVLKFAFDFQRIWMQNLLDLIQEGNLGLMHAVIKFDPDRGVKFSYYCSYWVKAYILNFLMANWRLVKIGTTQAQRKLFFKLNKEKNKLEQEGFDPSSELLSQKTGCSIGEIVEMEQRLNGRDVSLDAPMKEDSDTEMGSFIPMEGKSQEDQLVEKQIETLVREKVASFKKMLTTREQDILDLRIFNEDPLTLEELGRKYGVSRERIRQTEKGILAKIKIYFQKEIPEFNNLSYNEQPLVFTNKAKCQAISHGIRDKAINLKAKEDDMAELLDVTLNEIEAITRDGTQMRKIAMLFYGFSNGKGKLGNKDIAHELNIGIDSINSNMSMTRNKIRKLRGELAVAEKSPNRNENLSQQKITINATEEKAENTDATTMNLTIERGKKKFQMCLEGGPVYDFLVKYLGI
jgi:RNA polymerase sigma-32 factor